jgi:Kef-type K+ transport system membrane component KefB
MAVELSVLLYLAVFLAAAKLGGVLATKLGQPAVSGELVAGIMIGPFVAGWISQQLFGVSLYINPGAPAGGFMSMLAEVGIIMLMFLAGLSTDVDEFKKAGKPATIVAAAGVIVAFVFGFGVASVFGWNIVEAAFAGGILVATSVGITVRTLMGIDRLHTRVGMTILGAAVIDDVFGIIILSILSGIAFGSVSFLGIAETLGLMGLFFLLVILIGFKVVPRVITYVGRLDVEEITLSIALALVFLVAAFADMVSIAAITGAFMVGLIISKSQAAGSLRTKVSMIGYGFLIPLFFVEMGLSTDLQALGGVSFLALIFLGISMLSKIVGCGLGALLSGFGARDSLSVGVGMMPRAEVALVMAAIGISAWKANPALLPEMPALFSMTVMVVLVTSLVTPPIVKLAFGPTGGKNNSGSSRQHRRR